MYPLTCKSIHNGSALFSFFYLMPKIYYVSKLSHISSLLFSIFQKHPFFFFSVLRPCAPPSAANMTIFSSLGDRGNDNRSLCGELAEIFRRNKLGEKVRISPLSMEEYLRWVVEVVTVFLQEVPDVLKTRTESQRSKKLGLSLQLSMTLCCAKQ